MNPGPAVNVGHGITVINLNVYDKCKDVIKNMLRDMGLLLVVCDILQDVECLMY